ncbi:MAG: hypothetical protein GXP35_15030 [Actinobacteria bacterium]|nr:hypothetical protein [Actinomycetota bacterium]
MSTTRVAREFRALADIRVLFAVCIPVVAVVAIATSGQPALAMVAAISTVVIGLGVRLSSGSLLAGGLVGLVVAWALAAPGKVALGAGAVGVGVVIVALLAAASERRHIWVEPEVRLARATWVLFDIALGALSVVVLASVVGDSDRSLVAAMIGVAALAGVVVVVYALGNTGSAPTNPDND